MADDGPIQAGPEPLVAPAFSETMQVGIVLCDLDAVLRSWLDRGIGPWTP